MYETIDPDMVFILSRGKYQKHRRWISKVFITIAGLVIIVCLSSSTLSSLRRNNEIPNVKIIYQNPVYYHHIRRTQTGEMQFQTVLQSASNYKTKQLSELNRQNAGSYNYTGSQITRHFNIFANESEHLGGDNIQSISKKPMRRLPQAIIIGVKKCGTRALLEYLRLHPDIRAPGPEPHFFDRYYHFGLDWYRMKMPPTLEGQITMEKTPRYFITPEVPIRISNMSKDIKLIVVVRDPVIRAISDYTQGSSKDPNLIQTFADKAFHRNRTGKVHKNWSAIKTGIYINHVKYWLKYFPIVQMHFVSGENLVANPAEEVEKATDFLHLKRVISSKHFYFNETKGFPCLKKHERGSEAKCFDSSKGRTHPHVDKHLIQRLKLFFKPYNEEFYDLVGKDFGWS